MKTEQLKERLKNVPLKPGVYMYKDQAGQVIYVGKAKALRQRMRSYFQSADRLHPKVRAMMGRVDDFDFIVTNSEVEALILENNLIKAYQPRYNIDLRDDKTYPYLKISMAEPYPRVYITREKKDKVSRYFGPYTDVASLKETLRLLTSLFPLRTCKTLRPLNRPCLNRDLKKCLAPCTGQVSKEEYLQMVEQIIAFMEGDSREVLKAKEAEMKEAAHNLEFEKAARLRDQINAIRKISEIQKVHLQSPWNLDLIGIIVGEKDSLASVFKIRSGKIMAKDTFWLNRPTGQDEGELMAQFLRRYYTDNEDIPKELMVSTLPAEQELIEEWLHSVTGHKVSIKVPQRGDKRSLLDMMMENAHLLFQERYEAESRQQAVLIHLSKVLELPVVPERIECYDISHLGGQETVASMVVFTQGVPDGSAYRRFKIKQDQNDDFASMRETLRRRFMQAQQQNPAFLPEPDLVVIDGGLGQVNAVQAVLDELGVEIPLISLAEKNEEIYKPHRSEPLVLPRRDEGLRLLQRLRDEAHRFAVEYNRQRRTRRMTSSALDHIEGVGPQRRRALLKKFGSVNGIREASLEELAAVPGMNRTVARRVYEYFHGSIST
ncbi:MAG TPA: excinuclease ABC subunit UvrC [Syntrophomonadaceae bacterium]|jgi:excinuclease ABC subunit C|nr:excinuclease ABC subunit UvrC [Syntrophomonadaceae bacterium]